MSKSTQPSPTPSTPEEALTTLRRLQAETQAILQERLNEQEGIIANLLDRYGKPSPEKPAADLTARMQAAVDRAAVVEKLEVPADRGSSGIGGQAATGRLQENCPSRTPSQDQLPVSPTVSMPVPVQPQLSLSSDTAWRHMFSKKGSADTLDSVPKRLSSISSRSIGHRYTTQKDLQGDGLWSKLTSFFDTQEPPRSGLLNTIVKSSSFRALCATVILANVVLAIVLADMQASTLEKAPLWAEALELWFLGFFTLELILKLSVHRLYFFTNQDRGSNIFDFVIISLDLIGIALDLLDESGKVNMTFLRSCRISKITRILRLMRASEVANELRRLLEALTNSFSALMWSAVVIFFTLLLFALLFVQVITGFLMTHADLRCDDEVCLEQSLLDSFGSVSQAMLSLYMASTSGENWGPYYHLLSETGSGTSFAFILFTFCYQFGMFNLLTSMFVEKTMKMGAPDRHEKIFKQRMNESEQTAELFDLFEDECDVDRDGEITFDEFQRLMQSPAISTYLASIGLAINDAYAFFKVLLAVSAPVESDTPSVPVEDFVQGCMRLKGQATSIDVQVLGYRQRMLGESLRRLEKSLPAQSSGTCSGRNKATI